MSAGGKVALDPNEEIEVSSNSKKTTSKTVDPHVSDAYDRAVDLHNQLTQLSQSAPPQVDFSNVLRQATSLKSSLEMAVSDDSGTSSSTSEKQTENA